MKNWQYITTIVLLILIIGVSIYLFYERPFSTKKIITAVKPTLAQNEPTAVQEDSLSHINKAWTKYGDGDKRKLAYILATARHESRFIPQKEILAQLGTAHRAIQDQYWHTGYYGRGYIQLTHQSNYQKMSDFLGVDLVSNPDLALKPKYAAEILVYGMMNGSFAIKKPLSYYINQSGADYFNARRTVNGTDKAQLIADYATTIEKQL